MEDTTTADQLLHGIQVESLQQLLASVQQRTNSPRASGIPSLDSYLSAAAVLRNNSTLTGSYLEAGDVIQIQGRPGSGKTHLLYFLVASCIMPFHCFSEVIGGWAKAAFVVDTGGRFRVSRLRDILRDRLQPFLSVESALKATEQCLERVHIFRPTSSEQLAATLAYLPQYHMKNLPKSELGMLAIHSMDSFYWLDRFTAEQLQSAPAISSNIYSALETLRSRYGFVTILIRWDAVPQLQNRSDGARDQRASKGSTDFPGTASQQSSRFHSPRILLRSLTSDTGPFYATQQWAAEVDGNPEPRMITCEIRDKSIILK